VVIAHAESVPLTNEQVGRLAATRVAQVRARVAGIILSRVYTEGTDVSQGQVLFLIDPAPLKAALHVEEAGLAKAQADAANAAQIAKRYQDLATKGLIASQDLDTALANQRTTAAAVKEARANVEKAQLDLDYATVTAPIAGHAGRALVTEGALVGQGEATQLTTVEQIDSVYVNFSQPVSELQQFQLAVTNSAEGTKHADTQVDVLLPDGSFYPHPGILDFSDLSVDANTGTVSLRAIVPNPERRLLPGMFVRLQVTMGQLDHAFRLPQATVLRDATGAYVLVVGAEGKVEQRRVQTHEMTTTDWIVTGDLADGDQVILDGLQKVSPGAMAKVMPANVSDTSARPAGAAAAKP
jgi:membrane fusion protein (multidrug efflux system)